MPENIIALLNTLRAARGDEYADGFVDAVNILVPTVKAGTQESED